MAVSRARGAFHTLAGLRTKSELYSALRKRPELEHAETEAIQEIWPSATRTRATEWARKAKALMEPEDRTTFAEILAEVRMLRRERFAFRKAPAAMVVGLTHQLLRTHEWPMPGRRIRAAPP